MNNTSILEQDYEEPLTAVCSISNATVKPPRCGWPREPDTAHFSIEYLDLISYPVLLALSTVGNALNIFVLRHEHPRTSKNVYLMAMAVTDLTYMWAELLSYINGITDSIETFHQQLSGMTVFLQETAAVAADWTIVAFSIDRYLAVRSPLHHRMISSAKRSTLITAGIITASCSLASLRLIDYYWFLANDPGPPCDLPVRPPVLMQLRVFYTWTLPIIPSATFLTVLVLNGLLMRVLVRKRKSRLEKLQISVLSSSRPSATSSERSASLMLAACVLLYLITQSPTIVLNVVETFDTACIRRYPKQSRNLTDPIKLFFAKLNYSLNFVLYCALNPAFRTSLNKYLRRLFDKKGHYTSNSMKNSTTMQSRLSAVSRDREADSCGSRSGSRVRLSVRSDEQTVPLCPQDFRESKM